MNLIVKLGPLETLLGSISVLGDMEIRSFGEIPSGTVP